MSSGLRQRVVQPRTDLDHDKLVTLSEHAILQPNSPFADARDWGVEEDGDNDYSTELQNAIDELTAGHTDKAAGTTLILPPCDIHCNVDIRQNVSLQGSRGKDGTRSVLKPATNNPVISMLTTEDCINAGLYDLKIDGSTNKATWSAQHGIHMAPGDNAGGDGYSLDRFNMFRVSIVDCGGLGIYLDANGIDDGFIQRVFAWDVHVKNCRDLGLRIQGTVIECMWLGLMLTSNGEKDTATGALTIEHESGDATSVPRRHTFLNAIINSGHQTSGNTISLDGAAQCIFENMDLEKYVVGVNLGDNAYNLNNAIINSDFGGAPSATKLVEITQCKGFRFVGNRVSDISGPTTGIDIVGTAKNCRRVFVDPTTAWGTVTTPILYPYLPLESDDTLDLRQYHGIVRVEWNAAATAAQDLDSIYDETGAEDGLVDGMTITLVIYSAAHDIVVKDGTGNIVLAGSTDCTLGVRRHTLTLMWQEALAKWVEIARVDT